jgi:hypothetical protein
VQQVDERVTRPIRELPVPENVQNQGGNDKIEVIAINVESREVYRRAWQVMHEQFKMTLVHDNGGQA